MPLASSMAMEIPLIQNSIKMETYLACAHSTFHGYGCGNDNLYKTVPKWRLTLACAYSTFSGYGRRNVIENKQYQNEVLLEHPSWLWVRIPSFIYAF